MFLFISCYCDSFTCVSRFSVCVWSVAVLNKFRFVRFTQVIDQLVLNLPQTNGGFSFPLPWRLFNVSALLYDPAQTIAPSPSVFGVVFERGAHTLFTKYYDLRARVCWMKVFRLLFLQQTLLRNVNEKEKTNARVCVCALWKGGIRSMNHRWCDTWRKPYRAGKKNHHSLVNGGLEVGFLPTFPRETACAEAVVLHAA